MIKINRPRRKWLVFIFVLFLLTTNAGFFMGNTAQACCSCKDKVEEVSGDEWDDTKEEIKRRVESEFTAQRVWWAQLFWEDNLLPAMMLMTEQLTAAAIQQVQIIGSFMDAKNQMDTQQDLRLKNVQTHKDYHPSIGVCEFGTTIRSLAASERKSEIGAFVLSQRLQDRAMGQGYSSATTGPLSDKRSRLKQFQETYCDTNDNTTIDNNQSGMDYICPDGSAAKERRNKDIDFARTIDFPWTLEADFTDEDLTDDEEDIMALASNLYSHTVFTRPNAHSMSDKFNKLGLSALQEEYMNARALQAKQSVIANSFNAITAMRMEGTDSSREYLLTILKELGIPQEDAKDLLARDKDKQIAPSYYAQMEVLTKRAYQNPDFYTNLYDTPTNVDRKAVALQAINLMQKFDILKSYLRRESNASVFLELKVENMQDEIEASISGQSGGGAIESR